MNTLIEHLIPVKGTKTIDGNEVASILKAGQYAISMDGEKPEYILFYQDGKLKELKTGKEVEEHMLDNKYTVWKEKELVPSTREEALAAFESGSWIELHYKDEREDVKYHLAGAYPSVQFHHFLKGKWFILK